MLTKLKHLVEFLTASIYAVVTMSFLKNNQKLVIYYHSVMKKDIRSFDKQMKYLAKHFATLKASELLRAKNSKKTIAVTFDDGFQNFYDNAFPVLKKYNIPATVFITAGLLGKKANWPIEDDCEDVNQRIMTQQQLIELSNYNIEFMSHTMSHADLAKLDKYLLTRQLTRSKEILEQILDSRVNIISYPYGSYNLNVLISARKAGYTHGFTIEPDIIKKNQHQLLLPRFKVHPSDNILTFILKTNGSYSSVRYLRNLKKYLKKLIKAGKIEYVLQGN